MLKIVVVGCGGISDVWFAALQKAADVSVVGVVDIDAAAAQRRRDQYRLAAAEVGTDVATVLRAVSPDIVFDCTVPAARAKVVETALRHGCHVLSEKPMATTLVEARRLIRAAEKAGRLSAVMQNRRFDPRIRAIRDFLATGALGEVTTVNGDFYIGTHFGGFRDTMRHVLLLDMAIHSFDQARVLSGADPVAVTCHEWNPRGSWYAHDASAVALFEMSNGQVYSYRGSWCAEGLPTSWECDWRVIATRGSLLWDGGEKVRAQAITSDEGFHRPVREVEIPLPAADAGFGNGHADCIHDFLDCVRTGRTPETVGRENIKSLAMVLGAIQSAERGGRRVLIKM